MADFNSMSINGPRRKLSSFIISFRMVIRTYARTDEPCLRGTSSFAGVMMIVRHRKHQRAANQIAELFLAVDRRAGAKAATGESISLRHCRHLRTQSHKLVSRSCCAHPEQQQTRRMHTSSLSWTAPHRPAARISNNSIISSTTPLNQLNANNFKHQSRVSTWQRQDSVSSRPTLWPQSPTKRSSRLGNSNGRRSSSALYLKIKPVARLQRVCAMQSKMLLCQYLK